MECFAVFNDLSYELTDVRSALKALEKRVDTVERLALKANADSHLRLNPAVQSNVAISVELAEPEPLFLPEPHLDVETVPAYLAKHGPVLLRPFVSSDWIESPVVQKSQTQNLNKRNYQNNEGALKKERTRQADGFVAARAADAADAADAAATNNLSYSKEGLEVFVGRHLNKLGIAFLVIGCALALIYQFQYFSPVLKILSGLLGGALLIFGGERIEKNDQKMAWYGRALIGGGWALSYFSIFAAHHFPSVRIIESATIDVVLLFAVASGAIFHSLKYKSQTITGITLTLAFATICLSPATSFSLLASTMLVAVLVGLCLKMGWFNLFVYGECVFYAIYLGYILPQIMMGQNPIFGMSGVDGNFFTGTACSIFCWMAMNLVIFTSRELSPSDRKKLVFATLLNCGAFVPTVLHLMSASHAGMRFGFLLATGFAYLISTMTASKSIPWGPMTCNRIIGLSLITLAIPIKLSGEWLAAFWSIEVPLLVWAGIEFEMPSIRRFAAFVAVLAFNPGIGSIFASQMTDFYSLIFGVISFTAYGVTANLYRVSNVMSESAKVDSTKTGTSVSKVAFYFYFTLAAGTAMALLTVHAASSWVTAGYICGFALVVLLGFKLQDRFLRVAGALGMVFLGVPLFLAHWNDSSRIGTALIVTVMLYLSNLYRQIEGDKPRVQLVYQIAAATVLMVLLSKLCSGFAFEVALAVETLAILVCGFCLRDLSIKIVAFLMSCFMALKFVMLDVNNANSILWLGQSVNMTLLYGTVSGATLATAAGLYLSERLRSINSAGWLRAFYAHGALTALVVATLTLSQAPKEFWALLLSSECVVALLIGIRYQIMALRALAHFGIIASQVICLTTTFEHWNALATTLLVVEQYALSLLYTNLKNDSRYSSEHSIEHYYELLATVTTSVLLWQQIPSHWLSIALTLQGVVVLALGFQQKNKVLRVSGLVVLGLVIARLLFVELASIETIYRIMSFIGAGVVLLVASFAYARMNNEAAPQSLERPISIAVD
jgi:Predicted membrane protein (DUF2339)